MGPYIKSLIIRLKAVQLIPRRKICVLCSEGIPPIKKRSVAPGTAGNNKLRLLSQSLAEGCDDESEVCNACYMRLSRYPTVPFPDSFNLPATPDPQPGPSLASFPPKYFPPSTSNSSRSPLESIAETNYRRPSFGESRCFLCGSSAGRTRVPDAARRQAFQHLNVIIPPGTRCCPCHLEPETGLFCSGGLFDTATQSTNTAEADLAAHVSALSVSRPIGTFNFFDGLRPHDYEVFFGVTSPQMEEIFQSLPSSPDILAERLAFGMLLVYIRLGISQEAIASMFKTYQSNVSKSIAAARDAMINTFVPRFLGYSHITRQQYIQNHATTFSHRLTRSDPNVAICILDGTYIYCQKSADFETRKKAYSMHKFRNLIKPMMIVAPDGYILEVEGLYWARDNDASIVLHFMKKPNGFLSFFREDDVLVIDRGFRDACQSIENLGFRNSQPAFLYGASQFSTEDANESRLVTKIRWPIESINGYIKLRFKLFQHVVTNHLLIDDKIGHYFRIACALKNAYHKPVYTEKPEDLDIANYMLNRAQETNHLKEQIESMGLATAEARGRWSGWTKYTSNQVPHFPRLNLEDLQQITIGIYQIKQAASYSALHFGGNESYTVWINTDFFADLLRVRMESRHRSGTTYLSWIHYQPGGNGPQAIRSWYCKCPVGSRVVGTCSHIASVLWFLGYARHLPDLRFPAAQVGNCLLDAHNFDYFH